MFCIERTSTVLCVTVYLLGQITAGFMHWKNQYCIVHCILVGLTKRRFYVISFQEVVSWFPYGGALSMLVLLSLSMFGVEVSEELTTVYTRWLSTTHIQKGLARSCV